MVGIYKDYVCSNEKMSNGMSEEKFARKWTEERNE